MHQADPRLQQIYQIHFIKKERDFIELLQLIPSKSIEEIEVAVSTLKELSPADISIEKIRLLLERDKWVQKESESSYFNENENKSHRCHEIEKTAMEQLMAFKELIPYCKNGFIEGGKII